jgi:hypothetical protein
MTAFDHEIVDIEKAGSRFVIGIVKNADGPRTLLQSILIPERVAPGASWKETTILGRLVTISD